MTSVSRATSGSPCCRGRGTSHVECLGDRARAAGQDDHAVAETHGLANVVGDEHTRSTRRRRTIRSSSSWRMSRVIASSAPNGSSMSRTSAPCASARARATRCRIPPDSSCGRRSPNPSRRTVDSSASARLASLASRHACEAHRELHVLACGQPREERRLLEEQADATVDVDRSRLHAVEPGEQVEQGGLPAAGGTDQADELAALDGHRHVPEGEHVVAARAVDLVKATHLDGGRTEGRRRPPRRPPRRGPTVKASGSPAGPPRSAPR